MAHSSTMNAIDFSNVTLEARGAALVEGFSLALAAGERCTVTGPSGGGKSTLLRCLLGFAEPSAGEVSVLGRAIAPSTVWPIRRQIAWVAQEPDLGAGTAREALERPLQFRANRGLAANLSRVPELAAALRLDTALLDDPVDRLSGGEKQRVAILSALLLDRPILLLDEASSALDPDSRAAAAELLGALNETTILSVSHDVESFHLGGEVVRVGGKEASDGDV